MLACVHLSDAIALPMDPEHAMRRTHLSHVRGGERDFVRLRAGRKR
jgi:hypothetical protein